MAHTRYARNGPVHLAYTVLGDGQPESERCVLFLQSATLPMDALDEYPPTARLLRRLQGLGSLVLCDRRGVGQSDPPGPNDTLSPEEWASDLAVILDAARCRRVAVVAVFDAGAAALVLAAADPARIESLVLFHSYARFLVADDYPVGIDPSIVAQFDEVIDTGQGPAPGDTISVVAPSMADDQRFRSWFDGAGRRGAGPAPASQVWLALSRVDVRTVLADVTAETLVAHRPANGFMPAGQARYLAEHLPHSSLVELPGADFFAYTTELEPLLDAIEDFLAPDGGPGPGDRTLATLLFTDVVESTGRAAELGDRRWTAVLDAHDSLADRVLTRYGGTLVKTTGDGLLVTFDGPGQALRCAAALRDELRDLGLEIRSGVHSGEVERRGDDLGGIAVHIAARVMAEAGPGEVYVSPAVPMLLAGSEFTFEERGTRELKGVPGSWQLFEARV